VLILFGEGPRGPDVLLLRRADTLGSHAGQVAFPGGGVDKTDDGPVATALREAEEETGVDPSGVRPLAVLPELVLAVSSFAVTPVLAHWQEPSPVHAVDPGETAAVARVAIADLVDPANRFLVHRAGTPIQTPAFAVDGLFVWGFTGGLLSALLSLAGWEREWDRNDVRDLDLVLRDHEWETR
jgi:8-oxo-dGTP pyrophosphatase MutT (NUDIX family)